MLTVIKCSHQFFECDYSEDISYMLEHLVKGNYITEKGAVQACPECYKD